MRVTGYQFPDAEDAAKRYSWHMVEGAAADAEGSWRFRYSALTCDESPQLAVWLREVAHTDVPASLSPTALAFIEPNLSMAATRFEPAFIEITIGLDLEFSPPWQRRRTAGDPYLICCELTPEQLVRAATGE
ncbi:hypothetical protein J5X84_38335 [Streptosporangiaceae bacterium NEAU-GS5]|nr:hypothetical protein [Streptosporangiaceae bacterium NEAU-GS5]